MTAVSGQIVKSSGSARPAQIQGSGFASIEELRIQADEIKMVAEIFGIEGEQLRHLKNAFFFASVGNGLVPEVFNGDYRSIFIMSQLSETMKMPLSETLQGCYFVHGRLGWYTEFMIKRVVGLGIFTAIEYESGGDLKDETAWTRAVGIRPDGSKAQGTVVSLKMARAEGWFDKKGSKWLTMPALMLRKRAAAFMIREHAPHIFGQTAMSAEEVEDIERATPATPQLIETKTDARETMAAIVREEQLTRDEQQRLDVLDRVEKKIAAKIQGGSDPVEIESTLGMALSAVPDLNIEQLMAVWEMVK